MQPHPTFFAVVLYLTTCQVFRLPSLYYLLKCRPKISREESYVRSWRDAVNNAGWMHHPEEPRQTPREADEREENEVGQQSGDGLERRLALTTENIHAATGTAPTTREFRELSAAAGTLSSPSSND